MSERLPLSALLSRAITALNADYEAAGAGTSPIPTLAIWSNVLQHIDDGGLERSVLVTRSRLSKRALAVALGRQGRLGTLVVGEKTVRLTVKGRRAREAFRDLIPKVERRWGAARLRRALERIVVQLELEHPHYPSSYGGADPRVAGGPGQDWKPVRRTENDVTRLPLAALLSQALMAFSLEYETAGHGPLAWTACVLRFVGERGVFADEIPPTSVPIPGMVRHGALRTTTDAKQRKRLAMTPLGRRVKQRYASATRAIERAWRARYGSGPVRELRASLAALGLAADLPHYPRTDLIWEGPIRHTARRALN